MYRKEKLESIIKERIAFHIMKEIEDGSSSLITVTRVAIDDEYEKAIIYISVLPQEKEESSLAILEKRKRFIAFKVLKDIKMRTIPTIFFQVDSEAKKLHN